MVSFCNDPRGDSVQVFELCRVRLREPLNFTAVQREVRGLYTHWYGGKTIACCRTANCEACGENVKSTWAGHIIGRRHCDDKYVIVIFTKPVYEVLKKKKCEQNGLLALRVSLVRMGGRENGPIAVQTGGHDKEVMEYADWRLEKVLMRLYADNANKRDFKLDG